MVRIVRRGHDGVVTDDVETPAPSAEPQILRGLRSVQRPISTRRRLAGWIFGTGTVGGLTMVLVSNRGEFTVATALLMYLPLVVVTTAIGGVGPGVAAALVSPGVANWFLVPPYHTFRVSDGDNIVELVVFVSVAATVALFAARAARREQDATVARADALVLGRLSQDSTDSAERVLELLAATFGTGSVGLIDGGGNQIVSIHRPGRVPEPDSRLEIGPNHVLLVSGLRDSPSERRLLPAFVSQLARSLERDHLRQLATEAEALARADELRNALLRSVSHDLRTPLAGIKATVSGLLQTDVVWSDEQRTEFLQVIETETDRLTSIVVNLLDLSRIQAGGLAPKLELCILDEVFEEAAADPRFANRIDFQSTNALEFCTDRTILARIIGNLLENAIKWSPVGSKVRVRTDCTVSRARIEIVDSGCGIPDDRKEVVLKPFHRLDDSGHVEGSGLGLAIVDRLVNLLDGRLELNDTPGGGLTVVVEIPNRSDVAR